MKKSKYLVIVMVAAFFVACNQQNPVPEGNGKSSAWCNLYYDTIYSTGVIGLYKHVVDFYIDTAIVQTEGYGPSVRFHFGNGHLFWGWSDCIRFYSDGNERAEYDSLSALYGDTAYNKEIIVEKDVFDSNYAKIFDVLHCANYERAISIDVTANSDWNGEHPAGSSLNDIVFLKTITQKFYIQSGYDESLYPELGRWMEGGEYKFKYWYEFDQNWQIMRLSEMTEENYYLTLLYWSYLIFDSMPENLDKEYSINVTVTFSNGLQFSDDLTICFNGGKIINKWNR